MLNNLAALCALIIGVGSIIFSKQLGWEANPLFLLKFGGAAIVGVGYLIYQYGLSALGLLRFKAKSPSKIFIPEDWERYDNDCIIHLRDRCIQAGSEEGYKVCAQLAAILFQIDSLKKE